MRGEKGEERNGKGSGERSGLEERKENERKEGRAWAGSSSFARGRTRKVGAYDAIGECATDARGEHPVVRLVELGRRRRRHDVVAVLRLRPG